MHSPIVKRCTKVAGVKWSDVLYAMTDADIDLNEKHVQEARYKRIGTPMFFGPDQPISTPASSRKRRRPGEGRDAKTRHLWQGIGTSVETSEK